MADLNEAAPEQTTDELYESVMAPKSGDIPMAEGKAPVTDAFTFTANGKEINATKDQMVQWASQGHDYAQKMEQFKFEREQFDSTSSVYKEIDEYAKANPEWFSHVQEQYSNRDAVAPEPTEDPVLNEIKTELQEIKDFKNEVIAEKTRVQSDEEDKLLNFEIKSIRDQYPTIDWDKPDESGHNLEKRVLNHAMQIGTNNFRASFRDYMHENLISNARESGKETIGKDLAKKTKLGLLGETPSPTKGVKKAGNIKGKSYEALLQEGMEEAGVV